MKKWLLSIDAQDAQLVAGLSFLGYGLFLVYPPSCFIVLGLIFMAPSIFPYFAAKKAVK